MQSCSQIVTANKPTPNFLQARCPSCRPNNSIKALKGNVLDYISWTCSSEAYLESSKFQPCFWTVQAPFMRQCWGLPHRLAQCMSPQGWKMLVNAALLSSMRRVYVVLPSSRVNSLASLVCRHDRVTREAGRVGLMGRDRGGGILSTLYLFIYTARLLVSVFL